MRNRKKNLVLLAALGLMLALMIGGVVANERIIVVRVFSGTNQNNDQFDAPSGANDWSWSIAHHNNNDNVSLTVGNPQLGNKLEVVRNYDDGGALVGIVENYTWYVHTDPGNMDPPGKATCTVANVAWNPSLPIPK